MGVHEAMVARAAKATRLAEALHGFALAAGAESDQDVADMARHLPMAAWAAVAERAGIRRPSPATVLIATGLLADRAKPDFVAVILAEVERARAVAS